MSKNEDRKELGKLFLKGKKERQREGRNTGFKKILDAIKLNGSPLPEFETDDDHTYFISRFYVHEEFAKKAEDPN